MTTSLSATGKFANLWAFSVSACVSCSKEAQQCFCGTEKCRGVIGGERKEIPGASQESDAERRARVRRQREMLDDEQVSYSTALFPTQGEPAYF